MSAFCKHPLRKAICVGFILVAFASSWSSPWSQHFPTIGGSSNPNVLLRSAAKKVTVEQGAAARLGPGRAYAISAATVVPFLRGRALEELIAEKASLRRPIASD